MTIERTSRQSGGHEAGSEAETGARAGRAAYTDESVRFPLLTLRLDGTIERANGAAREALGASAAELKDRPFAELLERSWRDLFETTIAKLGGAASSSVEREHPLIEVRLITAKGPARFGILFASSSEGPERQLTALLYRQPDPAGTGTLHSSALEATGDAILCVDLDGKILFHNERLLELWQLQPSDVPAGYESFIERVSERLEDPDPGTPVELSESSDEEPERESRHHIRFRDGRIVERRSRPLLIDEHLVGHTLSYRDVTREERAQDTVRNSERHYRLLFERNVAGVFRASQEGRILEVNEAFARMVGYDAPAELQGKQLTDFYASLPERRRFGEELERTGAVANREVEFVRKDGSTIWVLENSLLVEDSEPTGPMIEGTLLDITSRKRLESELQRMAYHDPLTELANRRLLEERARMSLAFADRHGIQAGLIYVDISHFKRINDTLGHEAGDEVLLEVSNRIRAGLRGSDTAARIGGDEFAVLLAEVGGDRGALAVAQRLADRLAQPFQLGHRTLHVDSQIGVAIYPEHAPDFEALLAAADRAMYRTKVDGNAAIEIYSPEMADGDSDEIAQEEELRAALELGQLTIHYQPVVRLSDGRFVGAEALVRWNHPERGLLKAREFIQLAERCGLIARLDRWVLEQVFRQTSEWEHLELPEWTSVNQSIKSLRDPDLSDVITDLLKRYGLPSGRIVLEVNEGVAVRSPELLARRLTNLQQAGVRVALDDFGTGHSTLAYIKRFPADIIKLDGFFVHDIGTNHDSRNLVRAIVQMGQALGVQVVAEKVETEEQYEWLSAAGCECAQGRYTGSPMPPEQLLESFRQNASEALAVPKDAGV